MTWPTNGTAGWEAFGTLVVTDPELHALPVEVSGYYYDPSRLNGIGNTQEAVVLVFNGSTIVVRRRVSTIEAEFLTSRLWGDALLDSLVVPELGEPCTLLLELYDDDRETVKWAVGTSPGHAFPFLIEPDNYAAQEIDPARGSATLGTVGVTIVDVSQVAGDQQSGFVTGKLADSGIADVRGRRARLRRFISEELGWYTIVDGPCGTPRMDASYAAFSFDIRDTRDGERKLALFKAGGEQSLLPEGTLEGYGYDPLQGWLIDPTPPLEGVFTELVPGEPRSGSVSITGPGGITQTPMTNAALQSTLNGLAADFSGPVDTPENWVNRTPIWFRWRAQGTADPWTEIRTTLSAVVFAIDPIVPFDFSSGFLPDDGLQNIISIFIGSYPDGAGMPTDGQAIDWQLVGPRGVPPTTTIPFSVDTISAGEFVKRVYDGFYSKRGPNGELVSSGIRYDEDALMLMTDPVRIRVTAAIEDARDWLEKYIFAPSGWTPALDDLGRVSPISQIAPLTADGLPVLSDQITEASPDWHAGDRIINVLRVKYFRDYRPDSGAETGDGLSDRELILEFRDPISEERHGEQLFEIEALGFRAVGDPDAEPVSGDYRDELPYQQARLRELHIGARYAMGAPMAVVAVMRDQTIGLRAGSWVIAQMSWFPDYVTGQRGLVGLAQVIALGDLDCKWRRVVLEMAVPLSEPGS